MSGGSMNYIYNSIEWELKGEMEDEFMNAFIDDFIPLVKDLEWSRSGDIAEEDYHEKLKLFKDKWFKNSTAAKKEVIEKIKDEAIKKIKEM